MTLASAALLHTLLELDCYHDVPLTCIDQRIKISQLQSTEPSADAVGITVKTNKCRINKK